MMKFLILTLMAFSYCFSESDAIPKFQGPFRSILKEQFNLTLEGLKTKCDAKDKTLWPQVEAVFQLCLKGGEDLIVDVANRAKKHSKVTEKVYDDLIEDRCLTNVILVNMKEFAASKFLPCLEKRELPTEAKSAEVLRESMASSCTEVKQLAKLRNANA